MTMTIQMSKTAETVGRNGRFKMAELQINTASGHDLVFIDPVSKMRNVLLNAGMVMTTTDMDRLARTWIEHRAEMWPQTMTEKNYAVIAKAIREAKVSRKAKTEIEASFAWNLIRQDPDFDATKFSLTIVGNR